MSKDIDELIQVAAVAVAMLEDDRFGQAHAGMQISIDWYQIDDVFGDIAWERAQQDQKFGVGRHFTKLEWAMILAKEIGQWASELNRTKDTWDVMIPDPHGDAALVLDMLSQVEGVARRWIKDHAWEENSEVNGV